MPKKSAEDIPGSSYMDTRVLPVCCPRCRKPAIADYPPGSTKPINIRCRLCTWKLVPPPADNVKTSLKCPDCKGVMMAARRAGTLEIDHLWCADCNETIHLP